MASNTYASRYLLGWTDANAGLYSPPDTSFQHFLLQSTARYEFDTLRVAYDDGYLDNAGSLRDRPCAPFLRKSLS